MQIIHLIFALILGISFADTPPPQTINSKTQDGSGNAITSTIVTGKRGLDVNVISASGSSTVNQGTGGVSPWLITGTVSATQGTSPWVVSGSLGRTWSLLNTTDSVNVGNFPSFTGLTDAQLRASPVPISGTIAVSNFPATQAVTQSGTWTTGRTWSLLNSTDSVNVGNFPATQPVSGTIAATQSGTWTVQQGSPPWTVSAPVSTTGSGSAAGATVSTVQTLTAPANAVGFVLMNMDTSTTNMRWAIGRTATTTLGQQLQPGRDTGFVPAGANISIIAESGTVTYDIQWVSQ